MTEYVVGCEQSQHAESCKACRSRKQYISVLNSLSTGKINHNHIHRCTLYFVICEPPCRYERNLCSRNLYLHTLMHPALEGHHSGEDWNNTSCEFIDGDRAWLNINVNANSFAAFIWTSENGFIHHTLWTIDNFVVHWQVLGYHYWHSDDEREPSESLLWVLAAHTAYLMPLLFL